MSGETLERLGGAVLLLGLDGSIPGANSRACSAYRCSHAEMLALRLHDLVESTERGDVDAQIREASGRGGLFEPMHRRCDGAPFPVEIRYVPVGVEGNAALPGFVRDISQRRDAEAALRASQERFDTIGESISDVVWILDPITCRFLYVSPSAQKLNGYSAGEGMTESIDRVMAPDSARVTREHIRERMERFLATRELPEGATTLEIEHTRSDVSTAWTEVTASWRLNERTGQPEVYGVARDITSRRRAEAYREATREVLQILNDPETLHDSIQRVITVLKVSTGFDAIGIRLQAGGDYPYFAQESFSESFIDTENSLVEHDA